MKSRAIITLLTLAFSLHISAAEFEATFEADEGLSKNTRKWAEEFITFAAETHDVQLDWSQVSIKYLDDIVNGLHESYVKEQPSDEVIAPIARALGSYVAEVYRIFNGGEWGWIGIESGSYPGIKAESGATFLPLKKAIDRIKTGEDPDIWEYFQLISDY